MCVETRESHLAYVKMNLTVAEVRKERVQEAMALELRNVGGYDALILFVC